MDLTEFGPHLLSHYDSIGADLHALVAEWESGRALLALSIDKQDARNSMGSIDLNKFSPTGSTLAGDTPRNSYGGGKAWEDMIGSGLASPANAGSDKDKDENSDEPHQVVFEAVADPRPVRNSLSKLTREERIKKVQEERVRLAEERERAKAGATLVKELQTVLTNRQPNVNQGKRMSVRMS